MKIDYMLTLADYKAALKLNQSKNRSRRILEWVLYRIMPVVALLAVAFELFQGLINRNSSLDTNLRLLIVPFFFLLLPITRFNQIRKQYKQLFPPGTEKLSIDINDEHIICSNHGMSESRFTWSAISSFDRDDKITMLYLSKDRFLFFPTARLSSDESAELQHLVQRNLRRA